jgi:RIO-like serine/threonine protein kinase
MTEQQQEIILNNCEVCGTEFTKSNRYCDDKICLACEASRIKIEINFGFASMILGKLISGEVSKTDLKILDLIIIIERDHDLFSEFEINQTELAKKLSMQQSNISRTLKNLVNAKLLTKDLETQKYSFTMSKP